jgi:urease accessory protein UreE
MIVVRWTNVHGGGLTEKVKVEDETTVRQFLAAHLDGNSEDYVIRLNRQDCIDGDDVLKDEDRLFASPRKVGGA